MSKSLTKREFIKICRQHGISSLWTLYDKFPEIEGIPEHEHFQLRKAFTATIHAMHDFQALVNLFVYTE